MTITGQKIKPGLLFRSGDLFSLTAEDVKHLESIRLALIIDLRATREIEKRPDKVISTVREIVHIDIHDTASDTAEHLLEKDDAAGMEQVLVHDYRRLVELHQKDFRDFLRLLATTGNLPVVYHCAAGKDRTGLATVFLLAALGVDIPTIRENYLATNEFNLTYTNKLIQKVTESGQNGAILRPLMEVRNEYLDAALEEIDQKYGGLQKFVSVTLEADVEQLRNRFLE